MTSRSSHRSFAAAAAALFLLSSALAADDGTEAPAPKPAEPPAASTTPSLPWISTWEKARAAAEEKGQFVLLYVTQEEPPSERCRWLEATLFADPRASEIAAQCVMARLVGGPGCAPEVRAIMRRYGIDAYPCLYVVNARGHLVVPSMGTDVDSVLRALKFAAEDEEEFKTWEARTGDAERLHVRELWEKRLAWDDLLPLYQLDAQRRTSPKTLTTLAECCRRLGRASEERATLAKAIDVFEEAPERTKWRIRLLTLPLDEIAGDPPAFHEATIEALAPLVKQFAAENDRPSEAEVRYCIALAHAELHHCEEGRAEFDKVVEVCPNAPTAPKALLGKAALYWWEYDYANCKATCERVLAEYPKSPEAKPARHTIKSCEERMAAGGK